MAYNEFSETATRERSTPVGDAMSRLDFEQQNMGKVIEQLEMRLQYVLMPIDARPPSPRANEVLTPQGNVPLAVAIQVNCDRWRDMTQHLNDILQRVGF
jgi:hypothetical protein